MRARSSLRGTLLALAVLVTAGAPLRAGEETWDVAGLADRILAAEGKKQDALLAEAAAGDVDAWMLHAYLRAGAADDRLPRAWAKRVAGRAPRLRAYVETSAKLPVKRSWLDAVEAARQALDGGKAKAALDTLAAAGINQEARTTARAAAAYVEARAHRANFALERCVRAAVQAGDVALAIGWHETARPAFWLGLGMAKASGLFEEARECAFGLLAVHEAAGNAAGVAAAYHDLGGIDFRRGDLSGSLRHFAEALALYESLGNVEDEVDARSMRSVVYAQLGDYRRALRAVRRLEKRTEHFASKGKLADFLSNAALVYLGMGDTERSEKLLDRSLETAKSVGEAIPEATALGNMGLIHQAAGRWDDAIDAYRGALSIGQRVQNGFLVAVAQLNIAEALRRRAAARQRAARAATGAERDALTAAVRKDCDEGLRLLEAGLAVMQPLGAAGIVASMHETRCQLRLVRRDTDDLASSFTDIVKEAKRLGKWMTRVSAYRGLAHLHLEAGDWAECVSAAREAADLLADGYAGLADSDLARARSGHADVIDLGVMAAAAAGRMEDVHYLMERGRGGALLRSLGGRAAVLRSTVPETLITQLEAKTQAKVEAMAALNKALQGTERKRRRDAKLAYERIRDDELALRKQIEEAEQRHVPKIVPPRIESTRALKRRLRAMARSGPAVTYLAFNLQARDAWAFLVEAQGEPRVVRYSTSQVEAIHKALKSLMEDARGEFPADTKTLLKENLIAPLRLPVGPRQLLIAPDRELAYVPYRVILPDNMRFAMVPSATVLHTLAATGKRMGTGRVGLGDPEYGRVADANVFRRRGGYRLQPLPETRPEILAITRGASDVRLLGDKATEEGLQAALASKGAEWHWRAVHFACHGLLDLEWPSLCALALTPSGEEDGLLTVAEILRLRLKCDLVVMSACQTGRGRYVRGEGVMGLARALMHAGAPRVVASLWKVEDESASLLMRGFHKYLDSGKPTAEALRLAQLEVRDTVVKTKGPDGTVKTEKPWAEPKHWAAWVLWGLPD